jgi:SAM-dependent methyltransferase
VPVDRAAASETLRVDPAALAVPDGELVREHRDHWTEVYDWNYSRRGDDPALDTAGWQATGTGEPLPDTHMAQWADRTIELVLATRPRRILELGCGTGLLTYRLHPHLDAYVGTDIAADVVDRLGALGLPRVRIVHAAAHELNLPAVQVALDGAAPDCVLLNSVSQCFPDVAYLTAVLRDAVRAVAPGGTVVVGDVRHSGLHLRHCTELERAVDPDAVDEEITRRAAARAAADPELLLDPVTVATAALAGGRPVRLAVHAKALTADTELTRYRFDAVLQVEPGPAPTATVLNWPDLGPDPVAAMRTHDGVLLVRDVPNALLRADRPGATAHGLRTALPGAAVLVDLDDPTMLAIARPAAAGALPAESLAGPGRPHEPLPAFARTRATETARRSARRAGRPVPVGLTVTLPAARFVEDPAPMHTAGLAALAPAHHAAAVGSDVLPEAMRDLDAAALHAVNTALVELGESAQDVVAERHRWILRRWWAALAVDGAPPAAPDLATACAVLGYPPTMATFFTAAATHLPALLRDDIALQSLLFPDGEIITALGTYQDNVVNTYLNGALTRLAADLAANRPVPLRVLELGAGVGGSTAAVLDGLAGTEIDYLFTDVSRFFTGAASDRFGDRPGLRFGVLDIHDLAVHPGRYDLLVAANVLHNAVDLPAVLSDAAQLLAPHGVVAIVESTREHRQLLTSMHFLMSPRPGRPGPGSGDQRAGSDQIFLAEPGWWAALAGAGLRPVLGLPVRGPLDALGQRLFVAARD